MSDPTKPQGPKPPAGLVPPSFARPGNQIIVLALQGADGRVHRLHKERIVLGSVVSADVRVTGAGISPIHAVVELTRDEASRTRVAIYDLASETGLWVNGVKTITHELRAGDEIQIGALRFVFSLEDVRQASSASMSPVVESDGRKLFTNPQEDLRPLLLENSSDVEEIFDFRPSAKPALEVVMSWHGTIMDVEHFVDKSQVTIGHQLRNDFGIPPTLASGRYALVSRVGTGFVLNLDPCMKGVVQKKGRIAALANHGTNQVPLDQDDFAKVSVGELDFYLSYTAAPPQLKRRRILDRDPLFIKILTASLAMTALVVGILLKIDLPKQLEAEKIPERLATILYQPEKYTSRMEKVPQPEPKKESARVTPPVVQKPKPAPVVKIDIKPKANPTPKPVPKEINLVKRETPVKGQANSKGTSLNSQNQAKEGAGARAKGKEGTRGKPLASPGKEHQEAAKRPSPMGGQGRGGGNSQVQDQGNVDYLRGATDKIQNLLGSTAANLGKGGEKIRGYGGFTTEGSGGLALSGTGRGGGGNAESLGGLTDHGRGGGRVGTGLGASGTGSGIIGGKTRVVIRSGGPEEAVVMGSIDADAVEAALLAHRDEFRLCYEKEINAENPKLAGRVGTSFVIGSSGRVTGAGIESTSLKSPLVERCILNVIRRIDFPVPRGAGIVQVTYPFKYSPAGR